MKAPDISTEDYLIMFNETFGNPTFEETTKFVFVELFDNRLTDEEGEELRLFSLMVCKNQSRLPLNELIESLILKYKEPKTMAEIKLREDKKEENAVKWQSYIRNWLDQGITNNSMNINHIFTEIKKSKNES